MTSNQRDGTMPSRWFYFPLLITLRLRMFQIYATLGTNQGRTKHHDYTHCYVEV